MRCREGESHAKVAQMGSHRGRSKPQIPSLKHGLLFSLYGIASFHLCVIEYSNFCHLSANHYFLEPCSEKRSYSVLSTKTPEFIISSYIGGCMVEIKLTDVLLPSETIEVKHFNMLRVPSPRWGIILWSIFPQSHHGSYLALCISGKKGTLPWLCALSCPNKNIWFHILNGRKVDNVVQW